MNWIDICINELHHILLALVRKCAWWHFKLCCKLSVWKVRHDCTQNIRTEYGTKQWSLHDTITQKCRIILSCNQCLVFGLWRTIAQPAWFSLNKYFIIHVKASTKIILSTKSAWSTCIARNKKGNAYIGSMLTLVACDASRLISAKSMIDYS
jgi:hypothetical protein